MVGCVALVNDLTFDERKVRLEFEPSWSLPFDDNLTNLDQCIVDHRVALEELLGCLEVTNGFVDVQLVQEVRDGLKAYCAQPTAIKLEVEVFLAVSVSQKVDLDQRLVSLADDFEDHPGSPDVSLAPDFLIWIKELKSFHSSIEHFKPAHVVNVVPLRGPVRD